MAHLSVQGRLDGKPVIVHCSDHGVTTIVDDRGTSLWGSATTPGFVASMTASELVLTPSVRVTISASEAPTARLIVQRMEDARRNSFAPPPRATERRISLSSSPGMRPDARVSTSSGRVARLDVGATWVMSASIVLGTLAVAAGVGLVFHETSDFDGDTSRPFLGLGVALGASGVFQASLCWLFAAWAKAWAAVQRDRAQ